MSNDEFDTWLSLVGRLLGLSERQRKQIGAELRDHLESRVTDLLESGMDKKLAVMQAVEEFGDAAVLAKNLQSVSLANRKRWVMRFMTLATAAMFLVAVLTMAMWPENARFGSPANSVAQDEDPFGSDDSDANPFGDGGPAKAVVKAKPSARSMLNDEIRYKLSQPFDLIYDAEPFGDIMADLVKKLKVNIVVDRNLDGVLDGNTEVSANLAGLPLSDSLRVLLRAVDATYAIKNGVLLIISIDDENEPDYLARHMIDVHELLKMIKLTEADRIGKPIAAAHQGGGGFSGGGQGGGGVFCVAPQAEPKKSLSQQAPTQIVMPQQLMTAEHLLIETITRVVSPDVWMANGGGNCDLFCIGGVLVLVSHEAVAEEVQDFVTDLEYQIKNRKD